MLAMATMPQWAVGGKAVGLAKLPDGWPRVVCERYSTMKRPIGRFLCGELLVEGGSGRMCSDMVPEAATGDQARAGEARRGEPARWPVTPT